MKTVEVINLIKMNKY